MRRYAGTRNSFMQLREPFFWTSTIHQWQPLLKDDTFKQVIISSLQYLCNKRLIAVYGFVIMPNHIHLMWEQLQMNGREYPKGSFEKFTGHSFRTILLQHSPMLLDTYQVNTYDRTYTFWQRDPLAIALLNREMAFQKLQYIHGNPLQEHWKLCTDPLQYRFSSALFYETGKDEFGILTHYMERF